MRKVVVTTLAAVALIAFAPSAPAEATSQEGEASSVALQAGEAVWTHFPYN